MLNIHFNVVRFAMIGAYFGTTLVTRSISDHLYRDFVMYAAIEIPSLFLLKFLLDR